MTEPIGREFERYKTTLRMEQALHRHTQAELEATLAELRAARKVVEASKWRREAWKQEAIRLKAGFDKSPQLLGEAEEAEDAALADYEASRK